MSKNTDRFLIKKSLKKRTYYTFKNLYKQANICLHTQNTFISSSNYTTPLNFWQRLACLYMPITSDCLTHFWIAHKFRICKSPIAVSHEVNIDHEQLCSVLNHFWVLPGKWLQILYDPDVALLCARRIGYGLWPPTSGLCTASWLALYGALCFSTFRSLFLRTIWLTDCVYAQCQALPLLLVSR